MRPGYERVAPLGHPTPDDAEASERPDGGEIEARRGAHGDYPRLRFQDAGRNRLAFRCCPSQDIIDGATPLHLIDASTGPAGPVAGLRLATGNWLRRHGTPKIQR